MKKLQTIDPFYEIFKLSLFVVWLPSKLLAYLLPFIALFWLLFRKKYKVLQDFAVILLSFSLITIVYASLNFVIYGNFIWHSSLYSFITYGSFIFLVTIVSVRAIRDLDTYFRYLRLVKYFIIVEATIGLLQIFLFIIVKKGSFDLAGGDVVQGSINILSFLYTPATFNNAMYAINLSFMLLFYLPYLLYKRKGWHIFLYGAVACLVSSVVHVFIALFLGLGFSFLFIQFRLNLHKINKLQFAALTGFILFFLIFAVSQPKNLKLFNQYYQQIVYAENPKTWITQDAIFKMPSTYPTMSITGLGLGQFSSRAGLIGTGEYLGNQGGKASFLPSDVSLYFQEYLMDYWNEYRNNVGRYGNSTMSRPFYSLLSIYTELGLMISAFLLLSMIFYIYKLKLFYINFKKKSLERYIIFVQASFIYFLFFLAFFENYLEVTQAIFVGILSIKLFHSHIKYARYYHKHQ